MLTIAVPGRGRFAIEHLVLDFNGTIAVDGELIQGVEERVRFLSKELTVHVITADTNGSVVKQCSDLPVSVKILESSDHTEEKSEFASRLKGVVCFGNGANDAAMFEQSDLAIAVMGNEGCAAVTLMKSDLVVQTINDGLDLLLKPNRLIASLRK
ncbi:haloacid dehalogenase [Bacillus sp. REN3]|uniref:HAD family hydrolase n=1 Tax=Bacillus sp. REN3 TaxID=2802440 RepID=UPI001AEE5F3B|nr:haloacid dehalogenase [Bacillus sp. REN3]